MQNSVAVYRKLLPHIAFMTQNACGKYVHRQIDAKRCGKFHAFSKKSEMTKKCFFIIVERQSSVGRTVQKYTLQMTAIITDCVQNGLPNPVCRFAVGGDMSALQFIP